MTGVFLSLEGIDGSGKSTQARLLAETLRGAGREVVLTREPGGSPGAEDIRRLLVEGPPQRWSAETEILLFTAARRDHVECTIAPALARGAVVITDRFADSTRVYQGTARADLRTVVDDLHDRMIGIEPELTLILDMPAEEAHARGVARGPAESRFESFGLEFQRRLGAGFRQLAAEFPERCVLVPAGDGVQEVAMRIAGLVRERLT